VTMAIATSGSRITIGMMLQEVLPQPLNVPPILAGRLKRLRRLEPGIARSWQASFDSKTWTFHIGLGVRQDCARLRSFPYGARRLGCRWPFRATV
jgi:hypothetical protein